MFNYYKVSLNVPKGSDFFLALLKKKLKKLLVIFDQENVIISQKSNLRDIE